jgi:hypothetical protein
MFSPTMPAAFERGYLEILRSPLMPRALTFALRILTQALQIKGILARLCVRVSDPVDDRTLVIAPSRAVIVAIPNPNSLFMQFFLRFRLSTKTTFCRGFLGLTRASTAQKSLECMVSRSCRRKLGCVKLCLDATIEIVQPEFL